LRASKKLLRSIENSIGFNISDILDPKNFGLDWKEEAAIELASAIIVASEKGKKLRKTTTSSKYRRKRRQFSKLTKQKVLIQQNFRCVSCHNHLEIADFDHIDGINSNNDISNCQALCPNCHAKKTRKNSENS